MGRLFVVSLQEVAKHEPGPVTQLLYLSDPQSPVLGERNVVPPLNIMLRKETHRFVSTEHSAPHQKGKQCLRKRQFAI